MGNRFWKKYAGAFREHWRRNVICLGSVLTAGLILGAMVRLVPNGAGSRGGSAAGAMGRYNAFVANQVAEALDGVITTQKRYWLDDAEPIAPKPNPGGFGQTEDPREVLAAIREAEPLLDGQELLFSVETERVPGSPIQYYIDDTILAVTWKQGFDECCYTFAEVKIAHPSQLRRFLAGGEFGSDKLYVPTEMAQTVNAVLASSGDFYGYRRAGTIVYGGQVQRVNNGMVDTCYIDGEGNLLFSMAKEEMTQEEAQDFVDQHGVRFSLAFGPVLVRDGEPVITPVYTVGEIDGAYPRSALCQLDKLHYLIVTANLESPNFCVPTLSQFRERVAQTGCRQAYTLDGGQTAVIAMGGQMVNQVMFGVERKISDIFYFATAIPNLGG